MRRPGAPPWSFSKKEAKGRSRLSHISCCISSSFRLTERLKVASCDLSDVLRVIVNTLWNKLFTTGKSRLSTGKVEVTFSLWKSASTVLPGNGRAGMPQTCPAYKPARNRVRWQRARQPGGRIKLPDKGLNFQNVEMIKGTFLSGLQRVRG